MSALFVISCATSTSCEEVLKMFNQCLWAASLLGAPVMVASPLLSLFDFTGRA